MSQLTITLAQKINVAHRHAISHADKAIEYARQAGELLLSVKNDLPHGDFIPWVECNVDVTPRQAQRYMAAAQGRPTPVRKLTSKTTQVSHLTADHSVRPFVKGFGVAVAKLADDFQEILKKGECIPPSKFQGAAPTIQDVKYDLLRIENALHRVLAKSRRQEVSHG